MRNCFLRQEDKNKWWRVWESKTSTNTVPRRNGEFETHTFYWQEKGSLKLAYFIDKKRGVWNSHILLTRKVWNLPTVLTRKGEFETHTLYWQEMGSLKLIDCTDKKWGVWNSHTVLTRNGEFETHTLYWQQFGSLKLIHCTDKKWGVWNSYTVLTTNGEFEIQTFYWQKRGVWNFYTSLTRKGKFEHSTNQTKTKFGQNLPYFLLVAWDCSYAPFHRQNGIYHGIWHATHEAMFTRGPGISLYSQE